MGLFNFGKNSLKKIEVEPGLILSQALADVWPEIQQTRRTYAKITATPSADIARTSSHFGYYPFLPHGFDYPIDGEGKPMLPLAQLNFAEMPALQGYPAKGILQFYIAATEAYGLDFDDPFNPSAARVVYFEDPQFTEMADDIAFLAPLINSEFSPVLKPHTLSFSLQNEYIGIGDIHNKEPGVFDLHAYVDTFSGNTKKVLEKEIYDVFLPMGHKVGGYAYFTQNEPRDATTKNYKLLFQLDSGDEIMWGDVGVGNFFIHPEALAKKDFSRVMYNWDCC